MVRHSRGTVSQSQGPACHARARTHLYTPTLPRNSRHARAQARTKTIDTAPWPPGAEQVQGFRAPTRPAKRNARIPQRETLRRSFSLSCAQRSARSPNSQGGAACPVHRAHMLRRRAARKERTHGGGRGFRQRRPRSRLGRGAAGRVPLTDGDEDVEDDEDADLHGARGALEKLKKLQKCSNMPITKTLICTARAGNAHKRAAVGLRASTRRPLNRACRVRQQVPRPESERGRERDWESK